jgi:hypothetical protein
MAPVLLLAVVASPSLLAAQGPDCLRWDTRVSAEEIAPRRAASPCPRSPVGAPEVTSPRTAPGAEQAFLFSSLLPGSGQWVLGQDRWLPYAVAEGLAWIRFVDWRRLGDDYRNAYRDLAWQVARREATGLRRDGDFGYYEAMTRFSASGRFDSDPDRPGIQPETDPATFNGRVWGLAREIHFAAGEVEPPEGSPEYLRALDYYLGRGVTDDLRWDWEGNVAGQGAFRSLIRESDESFRRSTTMVGVLLANRFLSAMDALLSARLREGEEPLPFQLRFGLDPFMEHPSLLITWSH